MLDKPYDDDDDSVSRCTTRICDQISSDNPKRILSLSIEEAEVESEKITDFLSQLNREIIGALGDKSTEVNLVSPPSCTRNENDCATRQNLYEEQEFCIPEEDVEYEKFDNILNSFNERMDECMKSYANQHEDHHLSFDIHCFNAMKNEKFSEVTSKNDYFTPKPSKSEQLQHENDLYESYKITLIQENVECDKTGTINSDCPKTVSHKLEDYIEEPSRSDILQDAIVISNSETPLTSKEYDETDLEMCTSREDIFDDISQVFIVEESESDISQEINISESSEEDQMLSIQDSTNIDFCKESIPDISVCIKEKSNISETWIKLPESDNSQHSIPISDSSHDKIDYTLRLDNNSITPDAKTDVPRNIIKELSEMHQSCLKRTKIPDKKVVVEDNFELS